MSQTNDNLPFLTIGEEGNNILSLDVSNRRGHLPTAEGAGVQHPVVTASTVPWDLGDGIVLPVCEISIQCRYPTPILWDIPFEGKARTFSSPLFTPNEDGWSQEGTDWKVTRMRAMYDYYIASGVEVLPKDQRPEAPQAVMVTLTTDKGVWFAQAVYKYPFSVKNLRMVVPVA